MSAPASETAEKDASGQGWLLRILLGWHASFALVGIDAVVGVVKVVVFVASAPGFGGQPGVANGASDLLAQIFGDAGRHARSAVGVAELPLDAPVEVELVVEVNDAS